MNNHLWFFKFLQGSWFFKRSISRQGTVQGTAFFTLNSLKDNTLHYQEQGIFLSHQGKKYNSSREYIYCYQDNKISVFFSDDRLFHVLEFIEPLKAIGQHQCGQDRYNAYYEFYPPNQFCITYHVQGPIKHYISETIFSR